MNITLISGNGTASVSGFTHTGATMEPYSSGAELARQRQFVFVGPDGVPRTGQFLAAGGVPDKAEETWVQKKRQGRNHAAHSMQTGVHAMISGNFEPYYGLMPFLLENTCGKPVETRRIANNAYATVANGPRRLRRYEFPNAGAPKIALWDVYMGLRENATVYHKTKARSWNLDGARNGETGSLTGNIEWHANDFERDVTMPFYVARNQVQSLALADATGGTFKVTVTNPVTGDSATSAALAYNVTAANLATALNGLATAGAGAFAVTGTGTKADPFIVTAGGPFLNRPLTPLDPDGALLTGTGARAIVTVTQGGSDGLGPVDVPGPPMEIDHVLVYLAASKAELDAIDMTDVDDARILATSLGHNFSIGGLWNPVWTENRSRFPSNFIAGNPEIAVALVTPEDLIARKFQNSADGCVADKYWMRIAYRCGGWEFWTDVKIHRSAGYDPNDSNDIFQKSFPFVVADDALNSLSFTTVEVL